MALKHHNRGVFVRDGTEILPRGLVEKEKIKKHAKHSMAYQILAKHNQSKNDEDNLQLKFDALASHDITYVGIIQTVRAACPDFDEFPLPYVLTNCHNSLCAVGGTTNEDDHVFGLSAAKKYGGIFVPPHISVIHQYMREMQAGCGRMILGSDSHTRYGPLGCMGFGEGGGELVKQILGRTYDIPVPEVVAVYLSGCPRPGVGPQDVALALIGAVFGDGIVKNKVLEFIGPGIARLSMDFRMGIDVMTTETTCLSSIWCTDAKVEEFFAEHGRAEAYTEMQPGELAYYDDCISLDLSQVVPMIAMPYHPSNVFTVEEVAKDGVKADQGIIAGCAGGLYESVAAAAEIMDKHASQQALTDAFSLSIYPASQPMFLSMVENGVATKLLASGVVLRTAFCGPCFGAGDVPRNSGFSIRHTTRNFPNREGSKPSLNQSASVALMDALSIAATAAKGGQLTPADTLLESEPKFPAYYFSSGVYDKRVYEGYKRAKKSEKLIYAPGIRDWPEIPPMAENMLLLVASYITDPVTTTDELIPSGETSAFRSNPYALAEFTLSRKDPDYVERAKEVAAWEEARKSGSALKNFPKLGKALEALYKSHEMVKPGEIAIGSVVYANKPGDGSAREQAASCQRVLGGLANIAQEYATKRYRSNLINWGMIPFLLPDNTKPFTLNDFIYLPGLREAISNHQTNIPAFILNTNNQTPQALTLKLPLSKDETKILLSGCLINHYRSGEN